MTSSMSRGVAALTALALLAGCGGSSPDEPSGSVESSAGGPATVTVDTDRGRVEVPSEPRRVVAADFYGAFLLVDLGITPTGAIGDDWSAQSARYSEPLEGVASVGTFEEIDYEAVLATDPDVIVSTVDVEDEVYERLTSIAPTVVVSFEGSSLQEVTRGVGEALSRGQEAEAVIGELAERSDQVAEEHADVLADHDFALVTPDGSGGWWLYGSTWTDLTVLTGAGLVLAPPSADQQEQVASYSLEELGVLEETDVLLRDPTWDDAQLLESPLWQRLPAVRANRVLDITTGTSSIGTGLELLDQVDRALAELPDE